MSGAVMNRSVMADAWGLPSHWECFPLRRAIVSMCDGPFGSDMKSSHYAETGVRLIRLQNIGNGHFDDTDKAFIPQDHFDSLPGHDARPGDLLVAGLGDTNHPLGRASTLPDHIPIAMVKADCFRLRLNQRRLRHAFVAYFLASDAARATVETEARGATRSRINLSGASRIVVPAPPLHEQERIEALLNHRLTRIEALISNKERLVELLQEKRQALITQAVTKGLDPNVPLKDSRVGWLGAIPEHWRVLPLRRVIKGIEQGWSPVAEDRGAENGEWAVLTACLGGIPAVRQVRGASSASLKPQR